MRCVVCHAIEGQGECGECRALAQEMRANAEALSALRDERMPPLAGGVSRRAPVYWWAAAAAAAVLLALVSPAPKPAVRASRSEPLKIKMLTPDPDVVIYWLIDSKEGE